MKPIVEIEEEVYRFAPPGNGAGPMWCSGSTCLVRIGDALFASGIETLPDVKPLCNCRWTLFRRDADGWRQVRADEVERTREPSPLVGFPDGRLFLSVNPTLVADPDIPAGPARPEILQFNAADPAAPFEVLSPVWEGAPEFTEHAYRSFAADAANGELILIQNIARSHAEWTFRDRAGDWAACGKLQWPWGAAYDTPQPIRVCYPNVPLTCGAVHFCGVSDIIEPYDKWRAYKREITGRDWDYDFRRLFYTGCPDIRTGRFAKWVEVSSRDATCGRIMPGDLWVAPDGAVHVVWSERALDERLRERFYPDAAQSYAVNHAVLREGQVTERRSLVLVEGGLSDEIPSSPRFHVTPDNRLFVLYCVGSDDIPAAVSENRLMEIGADGPPVRLPLREPLARFFTATARGGSPPSDVIDLLGTPAGEGRICYARIAGFC